MKFFKSNLNLLSRNIALRGQPIYWRYLQQHPKMNALKLYMPLALSLFFSGYYGYAYYYELTQHMNILEHRDIYAWVQQPVFIFYWLISIFSPFTLCLKTRIVFKFRYLIVFFILLHAYPLFLYGTGFAAAIFLCSVLYPLLFEYELGKAMP